MERMEATRKTTLNAKLNIPPNVAKSMSLKYGIELPEFDEEAHQRYVGKINMGLAAGKKLYGKFNSLTGEGDDDGQEATDAGGDDDAGGGGAFSKFGAASQILAASGIKSTG